MPIQHKFHQTDFGKGFESHNAILDVTPYKPEVMVLGTFNPKTPKANFADFYYGRNLFWPAMKNLFVHNAVVLGGRRMPTRGNPPAALNPTLEEILEMCEALKFTFADLIHEVLPDRNPDDPFLPNDNVIFDGTEYNLIQDSRKKEIRGLQQLDNIGQVGWNTSSIIKYLCENPQINAIYFTRQPTGVWASQWNQIRLHQCMRGRLLTNIFTPSGQGKPVYQNMERLLRHWVHNDNPNFGQLDRNWLTRHGVNPGNF